MNVNRAVLYLGCFSIGVIAGLRSLTAPALVSWAAHLGWLDLSGSWMSFLGSWTAIIILSSLALAELVADKLPKTPKRTNPAPLVFQGDRRRVLQHGDLCLGSPATGNRHDPGCPWQYCRCVCGL